ncbi:MAG: hypothetical protein WD770_08655 [Actinomycetota bacterium]
MRPVRRLAVVLVLLTLVVPSSGTAGAGPVTHDPCPGEHPTRQFVTGKGVLENLLFDGKGNLYVTGDGMLRRYDAAGNETVLLQDMSLGGLAIGPDRALYLGIGNDIEASVMRTGASAVWRITRTKPLKHTVYAQGFDMANGMWFDRAGNLYVSNDFGEGPVRIPRRKPSSWTVWGGQYGTNGIVVDPTGRYLDAAITFDQASRIVRIPLKDPSQARTIAVLSTGALTLEPGVHVPPYVGGPAMPQGLDDMTRDAKGTLYVTANGPAGALLKVDPKTGTACILADGLDLPSSVRFASAFGADTGKLYVTQFGGAITVVTP